MAPRVAYDHVISPDGMASFTGFGPVPAIERVDWDEGPPPATRGAGATVYNGDGTTHRETVLAAHPGTRYSLRMSGFTGRAALVIGRMEEDWRFHADGDGTLIERTFDVHPPAWPRAPLTLAFVHLFLGPAVRRSSRTIARALAAR